MSHYETGSPLFSKPASEVFANSAKSYFRPLGKVWQSPYRLEFVSLAVAVSLLAAYATVTAKRSSVELAEMRALTAALSEKVAILENSPPASADRIFAVESRSKALQEAVAGLGGRTDSLEKSTREALEASLKASRATEKSLAEARKLQVEAAESLKLARADLEKAQDAVKAAGKRIDALALDLGQVSIRVGVLANREAGKPIYSGTQTGRVGLPARYAPDGLPALPTLRLRDIDYKVVADFPFSPSVPWTLDGKSVDREKFARGKGEYDATLTMKFGTVVKVELKSLGKSKE